MPTFVVCTVSDQPFGFPVEAVEEIVRMPWLTPVSEAPPDVRGVVDFRGVIVAVLDPALRLVGRRSRTSADSFLVLLDAGAERVALVVEGVKGLVGGAPIIPPPTAEAAPFVTGHLQGDGDLVTLLNARELIRPDVRDWLRRNREGGEGAPTVP